MKSIFQQRRCLTQREVRQYLNGELDDEQRYEVENHLLDCELCSAAVESYARNQGSGSFDEDIQSIRTEVNASARNPSPQRRLWLNRAAAAALILLAAYAAIRYWGASQPERAFTAYFEPAPNTYITYRSAGAEAAALPGELKQALEFYDAGAFDLSLPHFQNYLEENPDDLQALMLAANAHLHAGRADKAEQYLLRLEAEGELFQGQAAWYLALAFLRQGKEGPARERLKQISADNTSPFREKAAEVLEMIK